MGEVAVSIPSIMTSIFKGDRQVKATAATLGELLKVLTERYGQVVGERLLDSNGRLKPVITFYVNGKNVRFSGGLDTPLRENDTISILPAVAGG